MHPSYRAGIAAKTNGQLLLSKSIAGAAASSARAAATWRTCACAACDTQGCRNEARLDGDGLVQVLTGERLDLLRHRGAEQQRLVPRVERRHDLCRDEAGSSECRDMKCIHQFNSSRNRSQMRPSCISIGLKHDSRTKAGKAKQKARDSWQPGRSITKTASCTVT